MQVAKAAESSVSFLDRIKVMKETLERTGCLASEDSVKDEDSVVKELFAESVAGEEEENEEEMKEADDIEGWEDEEEDGEEDLSEASPDEEYPDEEAVFMAGLTDPLPPLDDEEDQGENVGENILLGDEKAAGGVKDSSKTGADKTKANSKKKKKVSMKFLVKNSTVKKEAKEGDQGKTRPLRSPLISKSSTKKKLDLARALGINKTLTRKSSCVVRRSSKHFKEFSPAPAPVVEMISMTKMSRATKLALASPFKAFPKSNAGPSSRPNDIKRKTAFSTPQPNRRKSRSASALSPMSADEKRIERYRVEFKKSPGKVMESIFLRYAVVEVTDQDTGDVVSRTAMVPPGKSENTLEKKRDLGASNRIVIEKSKKELANEIHERLEREAKQAKAVKRRKEAAKKVKLMGAMGALGVLGGKGASEASKGGEEDGKGGGGGGEGGGGGRKEVASGSS